MPEFTYHAGMAASSDAVADRAYLKAFGLNLKLKRVARGLSQEQFAELLGLHRTFVGQLERGQRGLNIVQLPRIAAALGVAAGRPAARTRPEAMTRASAAGRPRAPALGLRPADPQDGAP